MESFLNSFLQLFKKVPKSIFEWRYQGEHYFFKSQGLQKVAKNDTKTGTKNSTLKSIEKCSKMTSFGTSWGGSACSLFWWFLASGPQVVPKMPPGGAQGCPEPFQVPIFYDFESIWGGFWCDLGYFWVFQGVPKLKINVNIWATFPLRWKSARVSKFRQHSPRASTTKVNIKI